jgi:hypothetical protein
LVFIDILLPHVPQFHKFVLLAYVQQHLWDNLHETSFFKFSVQIHYRTSRGSITNIQLLSVISLHLHDPLTFRKRFHNKYPQFYHAVCCQTIHKLTTRLLSVNWKYSVLLRAILISRYCSRSLVTCIDIQRYWQHTRTTADSGSMSMHLKQLHGPQHEI